MQNETQFPLTTIVLTFNSEDSLRQVVAPCQALGSRVLVVDSGSTDRTPQIAKELGCDLVDHPFVNYAEQRNWAQQYAVPHYGLKPDDWVLHVDSDEVVSAELAAEIARAVKENRAEVDGYLVRRLSYFLGRPIRYGHINPSWHLRLYRAGKGRCENRLYDQHFLVPGKTESLKGVLHDVQAVTLEKWTAAHNRWSTAEAREAYERINGGGGEGEGTLPASLSGDIRMKKRWLKNNIWYKAPLLVRPLLFFVYSYFIRLGFLDGKEGLIYHFLQAFWFRFLVDAKILEMRMMDRGWTPASTADALSTERNGATVAATTAGTLK